MTVQCPKCNQDVPVGAKFCPHCGTDIGNDVQKISPSSNEDEIPLQILVRHILKHKFVYISIFVIVILAFGGFYAYKKYEAKQLLKAEIERSVKHLTDIAGSYKGYDGLVLTLNVDGTAKLKPSSYSSTVLGYWTEKQEGLPIEIEFSESFRITIGSDERSYCRSLYFYDNALWFNLDAIRSHDYGNCKYLSKQK